jgi:hypothetical protein
VDHVGHVRGEPLQVPTVEAEHRDLDVAGHRQNAIGIGVLRSEEQEERRANASRGVVFVLSADEGVDPAVRTFEVMAQDLHPDEPRRAAEQDGVGSRVG